MNCKPGDLAICVSADNLENVGRIFEVVRPFPFARQPAWWLHGRGVIDGEVANSGWLHDYELRPLRDSGGEDETLTWAGKPVKATA